MHHEQLRRLMFYNIFIVSNNDNKTCEVALPISTATKNFDFSGQSCEQEESFGENDEMKR